MESPGAATWDTGGSVAIGREVLGSALSGSLWLRRTQALCSGGVKDCPGLAGGGRGGPRLRVLAPQELPDCSPDVHEVLVHAPGCLGGHRHRDPVLLQGEGRNIQRACGVSQPLLLAQDPGGSAPKSQRLNPPGSGNAPVPLTVPHQLPPRWARRGHSAPTPHRAARRGTAAPAPPRGEMEPQGIL